MNGEKLPESRLIEAATAALAPFGAAVQLVKVRRPPRLWNVPEGAEPVAITLTIDGRPAGYGWKDWPDENELTRGLAEFVEFVRGSVH